jgi:hypothetical protein
MGVGFLFLKFVIAEAVAATTGATRFERDEGAILTGPNFIASLSSLFFLFGEKCENIYEKYSRVTYF